MRKLFSSLLMLLSFALVEPVHLKALEVREIFWGFNNLKTENAFNHVSVLVDNPGPEAFDGSIRLECSQGLGQKGAPHLAPIYLTPGSQRWISFTVFVQNEWNSWDLLVPDSMGKPKKYPLNIKSGQQPARVYMSSRRTTTSINAGLPTFPEEIFPTSLMALEQLEVLVVDQVPQWEALRRQTLKDWIYLGGVLIVVNNQEGRYPSFEGEWSFAAKGGLLGSGQILYLDTSKKLVTPKELNQLLGAYPEKKDLGYYGTTSPHNFVLERMVRNIRPRHNWLLINFLLLIYLVWVGPVNFFLVRKKRLDYRLATVFFMVSVVLFSSAFYQIGIRGYSMPTQAESLTVARPLEDGRVAVHSYVNLFSRKSITLEIPGNREQDLFETTSDEAVRGVINDGPDATFQFQMPINTTMPYLHGGIARLPIPNVVEITKGKISIAPIDGVEILNAWVLRNRTLKECTIQEGAWKPSKEIEPIGYMGLGSYDYYEYGQGENKPLHIIASDICSQYIRITQHLQGEEADVWSKKLPAHINQAYYYVLAKVEPALLVDHPYFQKQEGLVLYEIPILPHTKAP